MRPALPSLGESCLKRAAVVLSTVCGLFSGWGSETYRKPKECQISTAILWSCRGLLVVVVEVVVVVEFIYSPVSTGVNTGTNLSRTFKI